MLEIGPSGAPVFISNLYTDSISDKDITKQSGILGLLKKGDDCMADKGFNINYFMNHTFLLLFNSLYLTYILHEYLTNWKSGEGFIM